MSQDSKGIAQDIQRVLRMEGEAILKCAERLRSDAAGRLLEKAVQSFSQALDRGGKVVVLGIGKSGKIAQKTAATLCSTGSLAVFLHPTEGLHGDLGLVSNKDAILIFSYTGNTEEIIRLLPSLKTMGVPLVGVGGNSQSQLATQCDVWIDGSVEQEACPHNLAPTSSTTLALALGDALAMALMRRRGFKAQDFAHNHPGGALGKRLNLKVQDLMHSGDSVPTLPRSASMDEVVMSLTQKKLGAVLIVEGPQLVGIITDGDLRRALQHREKFFELKVSGVMTTKPVTIQPEQMAQEAIDLMENRPSQIYVLPVVDGAGHWKGLIRLHDLARSL